MGERRGDPRRDRQRWPRQATQHRVVGSREPPSQAQGRVDETLASLEGAIRDETAPRQREVIPFKAARYARLMEQRQQRQNRRAAYGVAAADAERPSTSREARRLRRRVDARTSIPRSRRSTSPAKGQTPAVGSGGSGRTSECVAASEGCRTDARYQPLSTVSVGRDFDVRHGVGLTPALDRPLEPRPIAAFAERVVRDNLEAALDGRDEVIAPSQERTQVADQASVISVERAVLDTDAQLRRALRWRKRYVASVLA